MSCLCRAVCPVWSGWAWTASVRDLGQMEELGGILWRSNNGWKRRWCKGGVTADRRRKHTVGQAVRERERAWRWTRLHSSSSSSSSRRRRGRISAPAYVSAVLDDMKDWWRWKRPAGRLGRTLSDGGRRSLNVQTDRYTARRGRYDERENAPCPGRIYKLCLWCILLQQL